MSEQRFSVAPNAVTPLTAALSAGSTIINNDPASAVWIGATPGVAPGQGVRLGPKGSTTWTTDNAPAYACPDMGVAAAVSLTITTDLESIVNPVDVGVAVATQLAAQGIPNVLVGEGIGEGVLPISGLEVGSYATVIVSVTVNGPGLLSYNFFADGTGGQFIGGRSFQIGAAGGFSFAAPVLGPQFYLTFSGGSVTYKVYATNRVSTAQVLGVTPFYTKAMTQAWVVNNQAVDYAGTFTTNGGPHQIRWAVTAGNDGLLAFRTYDTANVMTNAYYLDTSQGSARPDGTTEVDIQLILPPGILKPAYQPLTGGTYQTVLAITPLS
jgi:hypothetical protein